MLRTICMTFDSRITPVDSNYQTCAECYAKLMVYTGDFDPRKVTETLNLLPSSIAISGQEIVNSRGVKRKIKESVWFLSSEGSVASKDIREHIDWMIEKLSKGAPGLKKLQEMSGVKITFRCVWFSMLGHSGPVLWPEQMKALADLDLECSFDIYFLEG